MKQDLPKLVLTPIGRDVPKFDGPPAYLSGASYTAAHNRPEPEETPWERSVRKEEKEREQSEPKRARDVFASARQLNLKTRLTGRADESDEKTTENRARQGEADFRCLARAAWRSRRSARSAGKKDPSVPFLSTLQGQVSVCVGVVLLALAVKAVDLPAAQTVSAVVSDAVTMEVDLDQDAGKLHWVQKLFPESVAVWFGQKPPETLTAPLNGRVEKRFEDSYPGIGIISAEQIVYACESGRVTAVVTDDLGHTGVTVAHKGGLETVYATLKEPLCKVGDRVDTGDPVGVADGEKGRYALFLQVLLDGEAVDPLPYFTEGAPI